MHSTQQQEGSISAVLDTGVGKEFMSASEGVPFRTAGTLKLGATASLFITAIGGNFFAYDVVNGEPRKRRPLDGLSHNGDKWEFHREVVVDRCKSYARTHALCELRFAQVDTEKPGVIHLMNAGFVCQPKNLAEDGHIHMLVVQREATVPCFNRGDGTVVYPWYMCRPKMGIFFKHILSRRGISVSDLPPSKLNASLIHQPPSDGLGRHEGIVAGFNLCAGIGSVTTSHGAVLARWTEIERRSGVAYLMPDERVRFGTMVPFSDIGYYPDVDVIATRIESVTTAA